MGSIDGFIKVDRSLPEVEGTDHRVNHYKEFYLPHAEKLTIDQASRCMDCGVPFCHKGCPLGNFIPDFNDAVFHEDWERAIQILLSTNNFPEFTGRICPAPCEGSCVLGINKPPVTIEHIEKTIIEKAFDKGLIKANPPTHRNGKSIAIVGSGPAGMAAADQLNKTGYTVTVFERDEKPGGLLRFGIPDFKLEKSVVERRVDIMEKEGISFKVNCNVGVDISVEELKNDFDAILLAGGSTIPRDLPVPGRNLNGIHFAMDFLTQQNKRVSNIPVKNDDISARGKNVVVIGGGDTGSDCIGTSNRQGAHSILQFELLEKPPQGRSFHNPWPEWPMVLRTSSSHEEGCEREWSIMTKEFIGDENGHVKAIKTVEIEWQDKGFKEVEGTEKTYPCELVLLAIGFAHPQKQGLLEKLDVELTNQGNVLTKKYQTTIDGVFAAGDMRRGQSLVVWAISEGREAAKVMDEFIQKDSKLTSRDKSRYQLV